MVVKAGVVNVLPLAKAVPPVAALYQAKVVLPFGVAVNVVVLPEQIC